MNLIQRRLAGAFLLTGMLVGTCVPSAAASQQLERTAEILFTHDTHDHWLPVPEENGGGTYGGYTRLATLLEHSRAQSAADAVFTLDAGDFSMGSLFQTIYSTDAPELRAMGAMGYDVTTLGNHEFDYRASGLTDMLNAATRSGDPLPAIVQANYMPPQDAAEVWAAWQQYGITDYTVVERNGVRLAVFGLMGVDADQSAPMSGMEFEPIISAARRLVAEIQANAQADFVVCLSHSGTEDGKGEDYELAKAVDGIDLIISGHTHTVTSTPIQINDTFIVSCGPYTQNLGKIVLHKQAADSNVSLVDYALLPIDEHIAQHPKLSVMANQFKRKVETNYLHQYGMDYDQVLGQTPYAFTPIDELGSEQREEPLGNLIADSYRYAVKKAEGDAYVSIDFAAVAAGVIRASFGAGDVTTADAFNVSSLGVGADGTPGYPLVSVWLYGRELKDAFEVDASVSSLMPAAQLYGSGMEWSFNPHRLLFNRVTACAQVCSDGTRVPIENDRLYRVVTGLYSGQMLGTVNSKSFGLLTITPRDKHGNPIVDLERYIVRTQEGAELKEWYALASYLRSMGTVAPEYSSPEGRKTVLPSWNPIALLAHPNRIALVLYAALLAIVGVLIGVGYRLLGRKKRRRYGPRQHRNAGFSRYRG